MESSNPIHPQKMGGNRVNTGNNRKLLMTEALDDCGVDQPVTVLPVPSPLTPHRKALSPNNRALTPNRSPRTRHPQR